MKVHQIDETSGSEEGEYVLTVQTNEGTPNRGNIWQWGRRIRLNSTNKWRYTARCFIYLVYLHLFVLLRRILLPHCQMFHLFGVPSFVCTVKTYSKVHQIDETSGSEEGEYVLTVQTNEGTPNRWNIWQWGRRIRLNSTTLPDVSSIWCTFICLYC
jgi:hypothetical protein